MQNSIFVFQSSRRDTTRKYITFPSGKISLGVAKIFSATPLCRGVFSRFFTEDVSADGGGEGDSQHDADGAGHGGDGLEAHVGGA